MSLHCLRVALDHEVQIAHESLRRYSLSSASRGHLAFVARGTSSPSFRSIEQALSGRIGRLAMPSGDEGRDDRRDPSTPTRRRTMSRCVASGSGGWRSISEGDDSPQVAGTARSASSECPTVQMSRSSIRSHRIRRAS